MKKGRKAVTILNKGIWHNTGKLKAAKSLADARNHILYAKGDLGGRPEDAFRYIEGAMDVNSVFEENGHHYRSG